MKQIIIRDIRFFEERKQGSFPSYIGELYTIDKSIHFESSRYSRKLRELEFITVDFDHLYIVQTPYLEEGVIEESDRRPEKWMKLFYIGVSPDLYNRKSEEEKHNYILEHTTNVLRKIAITQEQINIVEQVYLNLLEQKSNLEINHLTKESKTFTIIISYKIRPSNKVSQALIEYIDKITGIRKKSILVELNMYEDIFYLVSSITISNGIIVMKPRQSETANFHIKAYKTPLTIYIDEMPTI